MNAGRAIAPFTEADLVIVGNSIYHLALKPEQIAPRCLLVGDPERVPLIAGEEFATVQFDIEHRGLRTMTGQLPGGERISIVTTGMGTPSAEIVLGELVALNEIDFSTRRAKPEWEPLTLIRVGTSGGLQPQASTPLGTLIISEYAVGLDNTGLFYDAPIESDPFLSELMETVESALLQATSPASSAYGRIKPYVSKAAPALVAALVAACEEKGYPYKKGITVSNSGFFANQGRDIFRIKPAIMDIDRVLAALEFSNDLRIENMEMESSFLLRFCAGLGYFAGSICPTVANRAANTFLNDSQHCVKQAAQIATLALKSGTI